MVQLIQHVFIQHLQTILPQITRLEYFSDGCAGQYKNKKNLYNLCQHKNDFGIEATWNFFATSHGKSPCGGIGGTVKRVTGRASLQRLKENHILTALQMFNFCSTTANLSSIQFFFISKIEVAQKREILTKRYAN